MIVKSSAENVENPIFPVNKLSCSSKTDSNPKLNKNAPRIGFSVKVFIATPSPIIIPASIDFFNVVVIKSLLLFV